eukprot:14476062-Alexandrium_andersonii.AAC.1
MIEPVMRNECVAFARNLKLLTEAVLVGELLLCADTVPILLTDRRQPSANTAGETEAEAGA